MNLSNLILIWFILGMGLVFLELIIPGGIVAFLGISALIVSACLYFGIITSVLHALTLWFLSSLILLFGLRGVVQKFVPAEVTKSNTNEDLDAYNTIVSVSQTIPANDIGKIKFRGTSWEARNYHQDIDLEINAKVRIIFRENLTWVVEEENKKQ